ncbi:MarR family winged helix-turn-helix transcriptional regulator [Isoptericola sp. NPDC056578]|uniref:MarR family winged helix-turn-helix transcriptional regulator n=1 Tax=Isoptericola sp. NPDC056578 TaxID=3345870 RepID=UPI00368F0B83
MTSPAGLSPRELQTYFALVESAALLHHTVEQHLRADGDLSYVQFQVLARLVDEGGQATMTDLADGVVYSRSGLTHQAGLLEKAGLVTRARHPEDQRATLVEITAAGRGRVEQVMPGHLEAVRRMLFDQLSDADLAALADVLPRVRDHMRALPPRSVTSRKEGRRGR